MACQHYTMNSQDFLNSFINEGTPYSPLLDLVKPYQSQSLTYPKLTIQLSFLKRFRTISIGLIPFCCPAPRQYVQTTAFKSTIDSLYQDYEQYLLKHFKWSSYMPSDQSYNSILEALPPRLHIQQYLVAKLLANNRNSLPKLQYLLNFFYTLNSLKTTNKELRLFSDFLEDDSSFVKLFLFLTIRRFSIAESDNTQKFKRNQNPFQADRPKPQSCGGRLGYKLFDKIVEILSRKTEESSESFLGLKDLVYKKTQDDEGAEKAKGGQTLSLVEAYERGVKFNIEVNELKIEYLQRFLQKYLSISSSSSCRENCEGQFSSEDESQQMVCTAFRHFANSDYNTLAKILANEVLSRTVKLAHLVYGAEQKPNKSNFVKESFEIIFRLLISLFQGNLDKTPTEQLSKEDRQLKKLYETMGKLFNFDVLVVTKFCQHILKRPIIRNLTKKYPPFAL